MNIYDAAKKIQLPALILDEKAFEFNCRVISDLPNGKRVRIATKSIRSVELLRKIVKSSSVFNGVMSFSAKEAVFLAERGFNNILIGYPCHDRQSFSTIAKINRVKNKKIIAMVDDVNQVIALQKIAANEVGMIYVCIDVDMSTFIGGFHFGVRRSPLSTVESVLKVAKAIKDSSHLKLVGIMGYEAQIAGVGDDVPNQHMKNTLIKLLKRIALPKIAKRRQEIVEALKREGYDISIVNGGGTGSLNTTNQEDCITEITVGSALFSPMLFDFYESFLYEPSLYFALPIVRKPTANIFTCLGGGYIASGPHGKDKVPRPVFPPDGKLMPLEGAGEVQTPVYYKNSALEVGDPIIFRAAKAGEICERFDKIYGVYDNSIVSSYLTYRGEGGHFL